MAESQTRNQKLKFTISETHTTTVQAWREARLNIYMLFISAISTGHCFMLERSVYGARELRGRTEVL